MIQPVFVQEVIVVVIDIKEIFGGRLQQHRRICPLMIAVGVIGTNRLCRHLKVIFGIHVFEQRVVLAVEEYLALRYIRVIGMETEQCVFAGRFDNPACRQREGEEASVI